MNYTDLMLRWFEEEKRKGLVDFKVDYIPSTSPHPTTIEDVSREIWNLLQAPTIPDPNLF